MATGNQELDLGSGKGAKKTAKKGGSKKKSADGKKGGGKKAFFFLLLIAGLAAGWIFGKPLFTNAENSGGQIGAETPATPVSSSASNSKAPTVYLDIEPPLIVNFSHNNTLRYLQVSVSVMARSEAVIELVKHHMPAIRHSFIMLLSGADYSQLGAREGKENIRKQMLSRVRKIVSQDGGAGEVEDLFITGFVMQ